jgi:hypothetical protein
MLLPFGLVLLVLDQYTYASLLARQTRTTSHISNSSASSTSATITNSPQIALSLLPSSISSTSHSPIGEDNGDCCVIIADRVALDIWYNKSLEVTVATVITQYLQYNDTVRTSLLTVMNNASRTSGAWKIGTYGNHDYGFTIPGVPLDLVRSEIVGYAETVIGYDTAITQNGMTMYANLLLYTNANLLTLR